MNALLLQLLKTALDMHIENQSSEELNPPSQISNHILTVPIKSKLNSLFSFDLNKHEKQNIQKINPSINPVNSNFCQSTVKADSSLQNEKSKPSSTSILQGKKQEKHSGNNEIRKSARLESKIVKPK